jgi:hypothetical protein
MQIKTCVVILKKVITNWDIREEIALLKKNREIKKQVCSKKKRLSIYSGRPLLLLLN